MSFSIVVLIFVVLTIIAYIVLGGMALFFNKETTITIVQIDQLLPQTQCGECGYPGCKPYAEAIANGEAINKCLPGGDDTITNLALLLNKKIIPLDGHAISKRVAVIREAECIGCTKCIQACPVDAILGTAKQMHTVINDECTGCDLCVDPCPVDCIDMIATDYAFNKQHAKQRFETRMARLDKENKERTQRHAEREKQIAAETTDDKAALIAAAIARSEAKKAARLADQSTSSSIEES